MSLAVDVGRDRVDSGAPALPVALQTEELPSSKSFPQRCTQKRALLIGVGTFNRYLELKNVHDDVYKIRDLLLNAYHYTMSEINILVDDGIEGHVQPTHDNILAAIAKLVQDVKEGDRVYFHYAGLQISSQWSGTGRKDGINKCLPALDGLMIVDELHETLVRPLPSSSHLVAVLDTCHSGSLIDVTHFRCNRVYVPWTFRGERNSGKTRSLVVRRNARLLTIPQPSSDLSLTRNMSNTIRRPSEQRSMIGGLPPSSTLAARSLIGIERFTGATNSLNLKPTSLARLRTGSKGSLAQLRTLSLSIPSAAKTKDRDKNEEQLELPRIFSDEEAAHCESPVGELLCDGWCRNLNWPVAEEGDEVNADVIVLASCKDSQESWDVDGASMTSLLVNVVTANPYQSLKDVIIGISHAAYSLALRHGMSKEQHMTSAAEKPKLRAIHQDKGYDMDDFRNPQIASPRPLDMNRPWNM
ncbi:caspase domain-containing protein [Mycena olivaceomarginata]|nr:caspase domain-containing protein [Mycena olivaceomarginata]